MTSIPSIKMLLLMVIPMVSMVMAVAPTEDCSTIVKVLLQNSKTGESRVLGNANALPAPVSNLFGRAVRPDDGWFTITTTETSCSSRVPLATASTTKDPVVVPIVSTPPVISHTSTITTSYTVPTTSMAVSTSASALTAVITTKVSTVSSESTASRVTATTTKVTTQSGAPMSSSLAPVTATGSSGSAKSVTSSPSSSAETASTSGSSTNVASTVTSKVTGVPPAAPPALVTTETIYTITVPCSHTEKCRSTKVYSTSTLVLSNPTGTHVTAPASGKLTGIPVSGSTVTGKTTDFVTEPCPTDTERASSTAIVVPVPEFTNVAPVPTPVTTEVIFTITVPCSHTEKCRSTEVYSTSTLVFSNPTGAQATAPSAPTAPGVATVPAFVTSKLPSVPATVPQPEMSAPGTTKVTIPVPETPPQIKVSESVSETTVINKSGSAQTTLATVPHPGSAHTTLVTVPQPAVSKGSQVPPNAFRTGETQIAVPTAPHPASSKTLAPSAPVFNGASVDGLVNGRLLGVSIFVVLANAAHFVIL
ncbi:uncharacterized protein N7511_010747 [Penicillium nucicola]|uniref:uncharacterized protein n=1 Tax=Penicillium nucicola TaxID=1850975 RepID=UPI002545B904|nr:uncharacterized protein N7511_010747 [Penicillium nucicola]KAJ5749051.1 hypothetical protein N7511_010747 [Penicillium nucicola]